MVTRRLAYEGGDSDPGQQAQGQVDVEHPAPAVVLGEPTAQRGAEDGAHHHTHTPHRHRLAMAFGWVGVEQHRLRQGHEAGTKNPLQETKSHDFGQALRRAAEHRCEREADYRPHENTLATPACGDKAGQRHEDGGGDDIRRQHPGDLILGRAHRALHVRQGDVGDGHVQRLDNGRQHHGKRDPGALGTIRFDSRGWNRCHACVRIHGRGLRACTRTGGGDDRCRSRPPHSDRRAIWADRA